MAGESSFRVTSPPSDAEMGNPDGGREWGGWQLDQEREETGPCGESPKENQGPAESAWGKATTEALGGECGEVLGLV